MATRDERRKDFDELHGVAGESKNRTPAEQDTAELVYLRELDRLRQEAGITAAMLRDGRAKAMAQAGRVEPLQIEADTIAHFEKGVRGEPGMYPDWVYEAARAIKHANENIPWLPDLLKILGWQGGTVHQAMNAVWRLVEAEKDRERERKREAARKQPHGGIGYPD